MQISEQEEIVSVWHCLLKEITVGATYFFLLQQSRHRHEQIRFSRYPCIKGADILRFRSPKADDCPLHDFITCVPIKLAFLITAVKPVLPHIPASAVQHLQKA